MILEPGPAHQFSFGRRGFLKTLGGGILVVSFLKRATAQESGGGARGGHSTPQEIGAWLHIDSKGF
jgi:hypothetical protein